MISNRRSFCSGDSLINMKNKKNKGINFPPDDPRSNLYQRELARPHIIWYKVTLLCFVPLILLIALFCVLNLKCDASYAIIVTVSVMFFYSMLMLKRSIISWIRLYQHFAPDRVRLKCRFEPSCSQYMILAIEKYGVFSGLIKGIKRLGKCNNRGNGMRGGIDFP